MKKVELKQTNIVQGVLQSCGACALTEVLASMNLLPTQNIITINEQALNLDLDLNDIANKQIFPVTGILSQSGGIKKADTPADKIGNSPVVIAQIAQKLGVKADIKVLKGAYADLQHLWPTEIENAQKADLFDENTSLIEQYQLPAQGSNVFHILCVDGAEHYIAVDSSRKLFDSNDGSLGNTDNLIKDYGTPALWIELSIVV